MDGGEIVRNGSEQTGKERAPAIEVHTIGDIAVLSLQPHVVEEDIAALMAEAKACIERGSRKLVVDITRTDAFIGDDLGAALIAIWQQAHAAGDQIALAGLHGQLREFFESSRLLTLIDSYATLEEALDSFHEAPERS